MRKMAGHSVERNTGDVTDGRRSDRHTAKLGKHQYLALGLGKSAFAGHAVGVGPGEESDRVDDGDAGISDHSPQLGKRSAGSQVDIEILDPELDAREASLGRNTHLLRDAQLERRQRRCIECGLKGKGTRVAHWRVLYNCAADAWRMARLTHHARQHEALCVELVVLEAKRQWHR